MTMINNMYEHFIIIVMFRIINNIILDVKDSIRNNFDRYLIKNLKLNDIRFSFIIFQT